MPPPRTSHSCVPYKNRYLVVIGGENEEFEEEEANPDDEKSKATEPGPALSGKALIKTDKPGKASSIDKHSEAEDSDEYGCETKSKSLSDVWVFDTHLTKWFELKPSLHIQGSGAGKRIRKQFEPRMAHSAVVLD